MGCCQSRPLEVEMKLRAQATIKDCILKVIEGDLSSISCDAILHSTNETLLLDSSDSKSLLLRGGLRLRSECIQYVNQHGPVTVGECLVTHAGALPCMHLIHVVSPIYVNGRRGEREALRKALGKALETAENLKCKSLSIPAIGTQPYAYPKAECTATIVDTVHSYLQSSSSSLTLISFVSMDRMTVRCFEQALERLSQPDCKVDNQY